MSWRSRGATGFVIVLFLPAHFLSPSLPESRLADFSNYVDVPRVRKVTMQRTNSSTASQDRGKFRTNENSNSMIIVGLFEKWASVRRDGRSSKSQCKFCFQFLSTNYAYVCSRVSRKIVLLTFAKYSFATVQRNESCYAVRRFELFSHRRAIGKNESTSRSLSTTATDVSRSSFIGEQILLKHAKTLLEVHRRTDIDGSKGPTLRCPVVLRITIGLCSQNRGSRYEPRREDEGLTAVSLCRLLPFASLDKG